MNTIDDTRYGKITEWVRTEIAAGRMRDGDRLLSENELAERFEVSRQTARHAVQVLEAEGLVVRRQGSGTYLRAGRYEEVRRRKKVAVVTTYIDSYIFPKILKGIEKTLYDAGYLVQISYTNNTFTRERSILEEIVSQDEVAGVILEGTKSALPDPNLDLLTQLHKSSIPVLFINSGYRDFPGPVVSLDDKEAGRLATEYLIARGHKNIAGIFKLDDGQGRLRYAGYREALTNAGLPIRDEQILWYDTTDLNEWLDADTKAPLRRLDGCSAVVCYNDQVAVCLEKALMLEKKSCPKDLSVVGIDNSELSRMGNTELTSIEHPKEELGTKAASILLNMIDGKNAGEDYFFTPKITERDSVRKL